MAEEENTLYPSRVGSPLITYGQAGNTSVSTSSVIIVPFNPNRKYFIVFNNGTTDAYLSIGSPAVLTAGIVLKAGGGGFEMNLGAGNVSTQAIYAISSGGGTTLEYVEGVA